MTPLCIVAIRAKIGASPSQFGRLLLGADAQRPDKFVARLENAQRPDAVSPTRPVLVLLKWLDAGGRPPDWDKIMGAVK
jgi:hypothetical protein